MYRRQTASNPRTLHHVTTRAKSREVGLSECGFLPCANGFPLTDNPVYQDLAYLCELVLPIMRLLSGRDFAAQFVREVQQEGHVRRPFSGGGCGRGLHHYDALSVGRKIDVIACLNRFLGPRAGLAGRKRIAFDAVRHYHYLFPKVEQFASILRPDRQVSACSGNLPLATWAGKRAHENLIILSGLAGTICYPPPIGRKRRRSQIEFRSQEQFRLAGLGMFRFGQIQGYGPDSKIRRYDVCVRQALSVRREGTRRQVPTFDQALRLTRSVRAYPVNARARQLRPV
jgi:hypothetical protein